MQVAGTRWLVVGMARSGLACAELLTASGARVILSDTRPLTDFGGSLDALRMLPGVTFRLGEPVNALWPLCTHAVISPAVRWDSPWIAKAQAAGVAVMGEIELGFRLSRGTLVGITGTNGKTTTTSLVGEMMANAGKLVHVCGNIGYPITAIAEKSHPEDVIVCEVSSNQLESISSFRPRVSAILNIREDHMDRHGDMATYIRTKARIMENQQAGDTAVLFYDDPLTRAMARGCPARPLFFSRQEQLQEGLFVRDGYIVSAAEGAVRNICQVGDVRIPGGHNLDNALAAAAIGCALGVPLPVIRHTFRTFTGVEHRIETVATVKGVTYINDSKGTNVDSTVKAIEAMSRPTVLLLGGYDKHADFADLAAAVAAGPIRAVVALGQTRGAIMDALAKAGYGAAVEAPGSFEEAVSAAAALAQNGDNVLLSPACASFDMFHDFEERGRAFKRIVALMEESA